MTPQHRASLIAALLAVDSVGLGGVILRSAAQPLRDQWLNMLRGLVAPFVPFRRMPHSISDRQLLGGLDLSATVNLGRPVAESGLLAAAHGGFVILTMAERVGARTASCLQAAMDSGTVSVAREGVTLEHAAQFGVVALDEGIGDEEAIPASLSDRLAFRIEFSALAPRGEFAQAFNPKEIVAARKLMQRIRIPADYLHALCAATQALGADSARSALLAARAMRAMAALGGRRRVSEEDLLRVIELVVAHRATKLPPSEAPGPANEPAPTEPPESDQADPGEDPGEDAGPGSGQLDERVIAGSRAAIPADLLEKLQSGRVRQPRHMGSSGLAQMSLRRGRPIGTRAGNPQRDGRLNVLATLQAAIPWQRLRPKPREGARIRIESSDFRITRHRQRTRSLIVFSIDASGSAALHRLAEAKGAVELILAECYVRRDQVAVIGFRGQAAQILLPATRSLVRAKVSLAGLPGGGATPLALGIEAAVQLAEKAQRRGDSPSLVFLTDGRANVGFNGAVGREVGLRDALRAATTVRIAGLPSLFIDTSPRPNPVASQIAHAMSARYVPLPSSDSRRILDAVKAQPMWRESARA